VGDLLSGLPRIRLKGSREWSKRRRPTLAYFKEKPKFDGISFSTTVHLANRSPGAGKAEAVEFFFPFTVLRCYEKYDCTGQQLIDTGVVLINGERVALDLQVAEGGAGR
jgi:hypothetical protein